MEGQLRRRMAMTALIRMFKPGTPSLLSRLGAVPRMVRATLRHEYDGGGRLLLLAMSAVYIISPVDVVPELVFSLIGMIDDAAVAAYFAGALLDETERFLEWEKGQGRLRGIPGGAIPPS